MLTKKRKNTVVDYMRPEQRLLDEEKWIYMCVAEAHRSYLKVLSLYKHKRYSGCQTIRWIDIDHGFIDVLEKYYVPALKV